ncbi:hypothetical protein NQZ68_014492 [Dissostichus eleginoides]|nr:hypothetical protein NQZ68_014492 [Dissostichus eleginoides]
MMMRATARERKGDSGGQLSPGFDSPGAGGLADTISSSSPLCHHRNPTNSDSHTDSEKSVILHALDAMLSPPSSPHTGKFSMPPRLRQKMRLLPMYQSPGGPASEMYSLRTGTMCLCAEARWSGGQVLGSTWTIRISKTERILVRYTSSSGWSFDPEEDAGERWRRDGVKAGRGMRSQGRPDADCELFSRVLHKGAMGLPGPDAAWRTHKVSWNYPGAEIYIRARHHCLFWPGPLYQPCS